MSGVHDVGWGEAESVLVEGAGWVAADPWISLAGFILARLQL